MDLVVEKYGILVTNLGPLIPNMVEVLNAIDKRIAKSQPGEVAILPTGAKLTVVNDRGTWRVVLYSYHHSQADVPETWKGMVF